MPTMCQALGGLGTETTGTHKTCPAHRELVVTELSKQAHHHFTNVVSNLGLTDIESIYREPGSILSSFIGSFNPFNNSMR